MENHYTVVLRRPDDLHNEHPVLAYEHVTVCTDLPMDSIVSIDAAAVLARQQCAKRDPYDGEVDDYGLVVTFPGHIEALDFGEG